MGSGHVIAQIRPFLAKCGKVVGCGLGKKTPYRPAAMKRLPLNLSNSGMTVCKG